MSKPTPPPSRLKQKAHYKATAETQKAHMKARIAWRRSFGYWACVEYGTLCDIKPDFFN